MKRHLMVRYTIGSREIGVLNRVTSEVVSVAGHHGYAASIKPIAVVLQWQDQRLAWGLDGGSIEFTDLPEIDGEVWPGS